jgi:hypothetical protein
MLRVQAGVIRFRRCSLHPRLYPAHALALITHLLRAAPRSVPVPGYQKLVLTRSTLTPMGEKFTTVSSGGREPGISNGKPHRTSSVQQPQPQIQQVASVGRPATTGPHSDAAPVAQVPAMPAASTGNNAATAAPSAVPSEPKQQQEDAVVNMVADSAAAPALAASAKQQQRSAAAHDSGWTSNKTSSKSAKVCTHCVTQAAGPGVMYMA